MRPRPGWHGFAAAGLAVALAWFLLPVLFGQYNEGFQTVTVMDAMAIGTGNLRGVDVLYPLVNDFFVASRFGVSAVLAGLLALALDPVAAFRLVMGLSLLVLLAANAAILVRRCRVDPVFALLPALLFPGTFESAWFFNDNVLSAALSSAALAVFWTRRGLPAAAAAAVLWGLAVACRTDAVLLAPAFLALWLTEVPDWRARVRTALVMAPLAALTPVLVFRAFGLNILDILPLTHRATVAWARQDVLSHVLHPVLKGFAWPGLVLAAAGIAAILAQRRWRDAAPCLLAPLAFFAAYGLMMTEVRYLLPLTPFFGILVVEGWRAILRLAPRLRTAGLALIGAAALSCFGPPVLLPVHALWFLSTDNDMPRPSVGRFWSPALSIWWNRTLRRGDAALADGLDRLAREGGGIVVSTRWTPDRAVDLILRRQGFTAARAGAPPSCADIGETWSRAGTRILHLRAHIPLIPTERAAVTWRALGAPCLRDMGVPVDHPVMVAGQMLLLDPMPGLGTPGVEPVFVPALDIHPWARVVAGKSYAPFVASVQAGAVAAVLQGPQPHDRPGMAEWAIAHRDLLR